MNSKRKTAVSTNHELPDAWENFCRRGKMPRKWQRASVLATGNPWQGLKGYYSGLPLDPDLSPKNALYPSHDHLNGRDDHSQAVVETRLVNDMKSMLTEREFWQMIEYLYVVGLEKDKIQSCQYRKLGGTWKPSCDFDKLNGVERREA